MVLAVFKSKSKEEKQKEVEEITKSIEEKVQTIFHSSDELMDYLRYMSKFYQYSIGNTILIQSQFYGANAVGSFAFWKKQGYMIKKGEKGIKILVPNKLKPQFLDEGKWRPIDEATSEQLQLIQQGKIKQRNGKTVYSIGHVFEASQTNMKAEDLPKVFPNKWIEGDVEDYLTMFDSMKEIAKAINVKIIEPKSELGVSKGVSYPLTREVALNPRNSELQNVKTLLHELAHAKLHTKDTRDQYTASEKEFQAEMVAFTVCTYLGIDTSEYSLSYLHHWTNGKTFDDHKKLLKEIRETAVQFISILDESYEKFIEKDMKNNKNNLDQTSNKLKVSQDEIDRAMKVDILDYLQRKGETFVKQGQYYRHTTHDSLVIKDNMYAWNSKNEKGTNPIVFARLFYDLSFVEAVKELNELGLITNKDTVKEKVLKEPFSYEKMVIESNTTENLERYLKKERSISSSVVNKLIENGYVVEDDKKNIVFKWKSHVGEIVGCDRQGTIKLNNPNYKHSTFKKIEPGKDDYGFNVTLGTPTTLYFFESPIDLASYWSLKEKTLTDCRLISMNGLKPKTVINFIRDQQIMDLPIDQMVLCVDNDDAGKDFVGIMDKLLNKDKVKVETPTVCKDWNDLLVRAKKRKKKKKDLSR